MTEFSQRSCDALTLVEGCVKLRTQNIFCLILKLRGFPCVVTDMFCSLCVSAVPEGFLLGSILAIQMWHQCRRFVSWRAVQHRENEFGQDEALDCLELDPISVDDWHHQGQVWVRGEVFLADSCSSYKWTREGGIYLGKQLTSWEVQKNRYPGKIFVSLGRELCYS